MDEKKRREEKRPIIYYGQRSHVIPGVVPPHFRCACVRVCLLVESPNKQVVKTRGRNENARKATDNLFGVAMELIAMTMNTRINFVWFVGNNY